MDIERTILDYVTREDVFLKELEEALHEFYDENEEELSRIFEEAESMAEEEGEPNLAEEYAVAGIREEFATELDELFRDILWENMDEDAVLDMVINMAETEAHPFPIVDYQIPRKLVDIYEESEGE